LSARMLEITGGNPGMIVTTVHALEQSGAIVPSRDGWRCTVDVATITLPEDLGALLRRTYGLDLLMADTLKGDILRAIAFAHESLTEDELKQIVQTNVAGVRSALAGLVDAGVLERNGNKSNDAWRFAFATTPLRDAAASRA